VTSKSATGRAGKSTSSATVAEVDAVGGVLVTAAAGSRCVFNGTGVTGSATVTGGSLRLSESETVALPTHPAPNTTFEVRDADSGETLTVIVNQQEVAAGSITVTAVRIILHGPTAVGDIALAQSRCSLTEQTPLPASPAPTAPAAARSAAVPSAAATPAGASPVSSSPSNPSAPAAVAASALPAGTAAPLARAALSSQEAQVGGGAYGYRAFNITLFGAPQPEMGPAPVVTLPPTGANPPLTKSAPSGMVKYLVAELFSAGELKVSTQGTTSPTRSSTSSASAANVGPGPFTAGSVASTCTSEAGNQTGSTTLTDAKLVTSEGDVNRTGDETVVQLPANPAPNTEHKGVIESVGDGFRAVFNEQVVSSGSITVNALHLYLLGPTAKGDLIVGQSRCGRVAEGSAKTGSSVRGASVSRGGRSASGSENDGSLASTGTETTQPLFVGLGLLVMGLALTSWSRQRPDMTREHRRFHERL